MSHGDALSAVERLFRRVMLMVGRGRVKASDDAGNVQMLQVKIGEMEIRDKTPRLAEYGFTSRPPVDSDAVLVFIGGDRSNGIVIATGNQKFRMRGLKEGEVAIYDDLGQSIHLTRTGIVIKGAGLPILVTDTPTITLDTPTVNATGDVNVDGNLTVQGAATVHGQITGMGGLAITGGGGGAAAHITGTVIATGDIIAGSISLENHTHSDPQGGSTGAPL